MHDMPTEMLTTQQVADHYGRSVGTINRWVREELLCPAAKAPGTRGANLFDPDELPPINELGAA